MISPLVLGSLREPRYDAVNAVCTLVAETPRRRALAITRRTKGWREGGGGGHPRAKPIDNNSSRRPPHVHSLLAPTRVGSWPRLYGLYKDRDPGGTSLAPRAHRTPYTGISLASVLLASQSQSRIFISAETDTPSEFFTPEK